VSESYPIKLESSDIHIMKDETRLAASDQHIGGEWGNQTCQPHSPIHLTEAAVPFFYFLPL